MRRTAVPAHLRKWSPSTTTLRLFEWLKPSERGGGRKRLKASGCGIRTVSKSHDSLQQRHDVSKTTSVTFSMQSPAPLRPKSSPSYLRRGLRSASPPKRVSAPRAGHLARRLSASHTNLVSKDMVRRLSQGMIKAPSIGGNDGGHSWSSAAWRHAERRASEQGLPACVPRRPTTCRNVASAAYFGHFL